MNENGNFSISDLISVKDKINQLLDEIMANVRALVDNMNQLNSILKEDNVELANSWKKIIDDVNDKKNDISDILKEVNYKLNNFTRSTLDNERDTSKRIAELTTALDDFTDLSATLYIDK